MIKALKDYSFFELEMCKNQPDFIKLHEFIKAIQAVQESSVILPEG